MGILRRPPTELPVGEIAATYLRDIIDPSHHASVAVPETLLTTRTNDAPHRRRSSGAATAGRHVAGALGPGAHIDLASKSCRPGSTLLCGDPATESHAAAGVDRPRWWFASTVPGRASMYRPGTSLLFPSISVAGGIGIT